MAAMASLGALALLLLSGLSCCSEACVEPQITPSYYTTSDAVISTETVFIVEISLTCKNRVQNMALYADVSGKQFPVTRGQDVGRYQVSWSLDHKSAHAGTYEVRFFDEESYSLLRKYLLCRLREIMRTFQSSHPCSQSAWTIGVPGMGPGSPPRYWLQ
ncbi:translocon-associated protein subunit delta isoform 4-T4 [Callospermophilus lateralis]|uniref:translocon-associated protein subunit delta isoform X5 n=1 Tax=Callospermophilus lateralis TaxID=76772 RepID=UPI0040547502